VSIWLEHAYDERCRELVAERDLNETILSEAHRIRDERDALLAALKAAQDYLETVLAPCEEGCDCILHLVEAAIAKAEGTAVTT